MYGFFLEVSQHEHTKHIPFSFFVFFEAEHTRVR